jgi:four helix bundle protein
METEDLKARTRQFALDVIDLCMTLGIDDFAQVTRRQLLRSGTGVATNYRAACRGRSAREFASRLATVVEEADESELWLDFLQVRRYGAPKTIAALQQEAIELRSIFAKSRTTTLKRLRERRKKQRGQDSRKQE